MSWALIIMTEEDCKSNDLIAGVVEAAGDKVGEKDKGLRIVASDHTLIIIVILMMMMISMMIIICQIRMCSSHS